MALHRDFPTSPYAEMARLAQWCDDVTEASLAQGGPTYRFVYVDEAGFTQSRPTTFDSLVAGFTDYQALTSAL